MHDISDHISNSVMADIRVPPTPHKCWYQFKEKTVNVKRNGIFLFFALSPSCFWSFFSVLILILVIHAASYSGEDIMLNAIQEPYLKNVLQRTLPTGIFLQIYMVGFLQMNRRMKGNQKLWHTVLMSDTFR